MIKVRLLFYWFTCFSQAIFSKGQQNNWQCGLIVGAVLVLSAPNVFANSEEHLDPHIFPRSQVIDVQVYFWKKIFTEVSTQEVLIHDRRLILPIYEKVSIHGLTRHQAKRKIKVRNYHVQQQLRALADHLEKQRPLSESQQTLLNKFYKGVTPKGLRKAAQRLRNQYGISDRFRAGLIRSGAYMSYIRTVFKRYDLPLELTYLPHVESSFNYISHSRSGAKGIWQFTRSTGKLFMRVNSKVDERIDPFISTVAAAKLLKANYKQLGSWPLAITAYNHGPSGVSRIAKKLQTRDLGKMIRHYRSRNFSFASKNFYAEFLAAAEVAENYQKYFGPLQFKTPLRYREIRLPRSMSLHKIVTQFNLSREQILALNPALRPSVVTGRRHVPSYYRIKVPLSSSVQVIRFEESLKQEQTFAQKVPSGKRYVKWITVRQGDTLSEIAERYGMSIQKLMNLNRLSQKSVIFPGQVLRVSDPQNASYVVVRKGDSLTTLAQRNGVPLRQLMASNGLHERSVIHPGQRLRLHKNVASPSENNESRRVHRVRRGETLGAIARRAGIALDELTSINGLSKSSIIYPGQRLILSL